MKLEKFQNNQDIGYGIPHLQSLRKVTMYLVVILRLHKIMRKLYTSGNTNVKCENKNVEFKFSTSKRFFTYIIYLNTYFVHLQKT